MIGLGPLQPNILLSNASANSNEPYAPFFDYLLSQRNEDLPYVLSISYGDIENTVSLLLQWKRPCADTTLPRSL